VLTNNPPGCKHAQGRLKLWPAIFSTRLPQTESSLGVEPGENLSPGCSLRSFLAKVEKPAPPQPLPPPPSAPIRLLERSGSAAPAGPGSYQVEQAVKTSSPTAKHQPRRTNSPLFSPPQPSMASPRFRSPRPPSNYRQMMGMMPAVHPLQITSPPDDGKGIRHSGCIHAHGVAQIKLGLMESAAGSVSHRSATGGFAAKLSPKSHVGLDAATRDKSR